MKSLEPFTICNYAYFGLLSEKLWLDFALLSAKEPERLVLSQNVGLHSSCEVQLMCDLLKGQKWSKRYTIYSSLQCLQRRFALNRV